MKLESIKVTVNQSQAYLFEQLSQVSNYEKLMPENIAKFEVTGTDQFVFGLSGMPVIKLLIKEKTPNSNLVLGSASEKLSFTLTSSIESLSENESSVQLIFEGEFNPMMAMMIKGPISKFIETLAENMPKL